MFEYSQFDTMPKFDSFTYWFTRMPDGTFSYGLRQSFLAGEPIIMGTVTEDLVEVSAEFKRFLQRPEAMVGREATLDPSSSMNNDPDIMTTEYETLMVGSSLIRALEAKRDPDECIAGIKRFLDWIRSTDFYSCPASTKYHDAEPSGLVFHSLKVYNNMLDIKRLKKFENVPYHSIVLLALGHDLTKIGNYELYMRNVKNEQTQQWEKVPSYRWKCNPFPFGHGVASMYIITQFFKLSIEEMLAIRWHMGEYRVSEHESGELNDACEQYPMVRMIQFADQLACVKY